MNFLEKSLDKIFAIAFLIGMACWVNALDDGNFTIRRDSFGTASNKLADYGAEMHVRAFDSAGIFISSGVGVLQDVMISTGAATDYVICASTNVKDAALVSYLAGGILHPVGGVSSLLLTPPILANTTNGISANQSVIGFTPTAFTNGLVCRANVASLNFVGIKYTLNGRPD